MPFEKLDFFSRRLDESLWSSFCWVLLASLNAEPGGSGGLAISLQNQTKPQSDLPLNPFQIRLRVKIKKTSLSYGAFGDSETKGMM